MNDSKTKPTLNLQKKLKFTTLPKSFGKFLTKLNEKAGDECFENFYHLLPPTVLAADEMTDSCDPEDATTGSGFKSGFEFAYNVLQLRLRNPDKEVSLFAAEKFDGQDTTFYYFATILDVAGLQAALTEMLEKGIAGA